jgi:hypothetical protein
MSLDMVFLDNKVNLNSVRFTDDFLSDVEANKAVYIGLPLVGDQKALTDGKFDNLTHKFNKKTGTLNTQALGSFIDFRTEKDGDTVKLIASARIWKRFPTVCAAIEELFNSKEGLRFSYECYVTNYTVESGVKIVDKDEANTIISSCLVSNPANPNSVGVLLVAEAMEADIDNMNLGGDSLERNQNPTVEEFFAKAKTKINMAELDLWQIRKKIYNQLKDVLGNSWYNYDVYEMGIDYVILQDYESGNYFKCDYSVSNDTVTVSNLRQVTKTYQDINTNTGGNEMAELKELQESLSTAIAEIETLKTQVADKDKILAEKDVALADKEKIISEKEANVVKLGETIVEKENLIATLTPFKTQIEKAELEKAEAEKVIKRTALTASCTKAKLTKEEMETAEMKKAIEDLDETYINKILASKYLANIAKEPDGKKTLITSSRITDNIEINGSDNVSKYVTLNK